MSKKKDESAEIQEVKASVSPISPLISNFSWVVSSPTLIILDFAFVAPSYSKPYNLEDSQVSRICMTWDSAEQLLNQLNERISEHKKASKKGKTKK